MKIIVLAGGYSPERDVSLSSGSLIANALMERGHEVFSWIPGWELRQGSGFITGPGKKGWALLTKSAGKPLT